MFWHNPPNEILKGKNLNVHSAYTKSRRLWLGILWVLLLPAGAVLFLLERLIAGTILVAGMLSFTIVETAAHGRSKNPRERSQFFRAYVNNVLATHLPHINTGMRMFLYRLSGVTVGKDSFVGMHAYMEDVNSQNVVIEDNVTCSFGVTFVGHGIKRGKKEDEKYIILRSGCYVGAGSIILPGVEIGSRAVVGAGSVVTKDVPPGAVVAGCPARLLYHRDDMKNR